MPATKWTEVAVFIRVTIVGLWFVSATAYAVDEEARVLILNGTDPYLPAYLVIDSAMRATLANEPTRRIVLFSETLDAQRFSVEALEPEYLALLTRKYAALHIDVVVAVTQPALDFFKRHGAQLWPGARLVFHGVPAAQADPPPADARGVMTREDVAGSIDLARHLQPKAHLILVIAGSAEVDQRLEQKVRSVLSTKAGTPTVEFLSGWPLPELLARVAAEPTDTIVLYLTEFRDRDGRPYTPRDVMRAIGDASAAPVYGLYETYVGFGLAAGSMESYEDRGRLVGELVRGALAGGPPAPGGRGLLDVPSRCVADARALKRWALDERRLPDGCEIRFADRPYWRVHFWQIVAALALLMAQSALITALLIQGRRRYAAEQAAQMHRSALAHASRLAVAGEMTASIAHEINQPLGAIVSNADAADLLLESGENRSQVFHQILSDIRRDGLRASEVVRRLRALLAKHEIELKPFDLNAAVTEVAALLQVEAERRRVEIDMLLAPTATVVGDRVQIQQVLINLLLNAMDAVNDVSEDRREIVIAVEKTAERIAISICDRGHGIAPEELPKLFNSFYSTKSAGMGLGLSIARTIVETHGGRVWAESRPGDGAVFYVEFPAIDRMTE